MQGIFGELRQCRQLELYNCTLSGCVFDLLAGTAATLADLTCGGHPGRVCSGLRVQAWQPWL
jgi:hypothetical protein